jgi:hypothetical protein
VDKEVFEKRIKKCGFCENLFRLTWTCKKCGCFMGVKARVKNTTCPIGRWDDGEKNAE